MNTLSNHINNYRKALKRIDLNYQPYMKEFKSCIEERIDNLKILMRIRLRHYKYNKHERKLK